MRRRFSSRVSRAALVAALFATSVFGQSVSVSVPGTSNPYLSGMPNGSTCCSGDSAPAQSPVQVTGLTLTPGTALTFSATGGIDFQGNPPSAGPDGSFVFTTASTNGISGATWPANSLVGVFLDNSQPDSTPAPADLNFGGPGGTAFATVAPALKQVFFIGDGRTGTGIGAAQTFVIPAGATRLFVGASDGFGWFNNVGSFSVTVAPAQAPPPSAATVANVPTLSDAMLIVVALTLAAGAMLALRRRA